MFKKPEEPDDFICGQTRLYKHKDMPGALRRVADTLPEMEGNPHQPVYGTEHLEIVRRALEKQLNVSIPHIYVVIKPEEKPPIEHDTDFVLNVGYSGTEG